VIGEVHANSRGTYGRLRVKATLRIEHGLIVNQKLVQRIMRGLDIHGLPQRKRVTRNLANMATHDDLVNRNFVADRPNSLWLTDITEHPTREGTVYCCCVLDIYSRKVVGWAIDRRCESILVNDALSMAARTGRLLTNLILVRMGYPPGHHLQKRPGAIPTGPAVRRRG
jgi:putative transposase